MRRTSLSVKRQLAFERLRRCRAHYFCKYIHVCFGALCFSFSLASSHALLVPPSRICTATTLVFLASHSVSLDIDRWLLKVHRGSHAKARDVMRKHKRDTSTNTSISLSRSVLLSMGLSMDEDGSVANHELERELRKEQESDSRGLREQDCCRTVEEPQYSCGSPYSAPLDELLLEVGEQGNVAAHRSARTVTISPILQHITASPSQPRAPRDYLHAAGSSGQDAATTASPGRSYYHGGSPGSRHSDDEMLPFPCSPSSARSTSLKTPVDLIEEELSQETAEAEDERLLAMAHKERSESSQPLLTWPPLASNVSRVQQERVSRGAPSDATPADACANGTPWSDAPQERAGPATLPADNCSLLDAVSLFLRTQVYLRIFMSLRVNSAVDSV